MIPQDPMTVVFDHVASSLPNGLLERKRVLSAVDALMLDDHPCKASIRSQLATIDSLREQEARLQTKFTELLKGGSL